jgi:hypothetical protein
MNADHTISQVDRHPLVTLSFGTEGAKEAPSAFLPEHQSSLTGFAQLCSGWIIVRFCLFTHGTVHEIALAAFCCPLAPRGRLWRTDHRRHDRAGAYPNHPDRTIGAHRTTSRAHHCDPRSCHQAVRSAEELAAPRSGA